jgi:exosortase/archaeosortase family protein
VNEVKRLHKWTLVFGAKTAALYAGFAVLYHTLLFFNALYWVQLLEAEIVFFFVNAAWPLTTLNGITLGNLVVSGNYMPFQLAIEPVCLGWFPIAAFASMVLALPVQRQKLLKCLAIGIPILFAANIARIVLIIWVAGAYGLEAFDFMHLSVVKFDLMLLVIALFMLCVHKIVGEKELLRGLPKEKE